MLANSLMRLLKEQPNTIYMSSFLKAAINVVAQPATTGMPCTSMGHVLFRAQFFPALPPSSNLQAT